jgi:hypothetical protein
MDAVLIKKSTQEIIKRADYPRADMQPVIGLDPDLEWLLVNQPYDAPEYDSRIFILNQNEAITAIPHPQYPLINQYQITFALEQRPKEDIELSVKQAEQMANSSILPQDEQLKATILALATIIKKQQGLTLEDDEQAIIDNLMAIADNFWKNSAEAASKIADIAAGKQPDIDSSWQNAKSAPI